MRNLTSPPGYSPLKRGIFININHMKAFLTMVKFSILSLLFIFCSGNEADDAVPEVDDTYKVVSAFPKLTFLRPVDLQQPNDGTNRIFVVEQAGVISVFPNDETTSAKATFL